MPPSRCDCITRQFPKNDACSYIELEEERPMPSAAGKEPVVGTRSEQKTRKIPLDGDKDHKECQAALHVLAVRFENVVRVPEKNAGASR